MRIKIIFSAFEIFSVTRDHWEFCNTIEILTKLNSGIKIDEPEKQINKNPILKGNIQSDNVPTSDNILIPISSSPKSVKNLTNLKLEILQKIPEISGLGFNGNEISILNKLYLSGNKLLKGSLDSYLMIKNDDELIDNLKLVLKKASK